eukprot:9353767-Karenia_brevis.AAC.1
MEFDIDDYQAKRGRSITIPNGFQHCDLVHGLSCKEKPSESIAWKFSEASNHPTVQSMARLLAFDGPIMHSDFT